MVYSLESGGIERYSINLYKHINKENYQLDFIAWSEDEEFFDKEFKDMGGIKVCLKSGTKKLSGIRKKVKILSNCIKSIVGKDYDIAYFNISSPKSILKFPLLCKLCGMKIIIHSHNSNEVCDSKKKYIFSKLIMSLITDKYLACSNSAALFMFPSKVYKNKSYELINNGIETEKYIFNDDKRTKFRKELNLKNSFVIGHIGRFNEQKNHKFIIDVFDKVCKLNKNAVLMLIGSGELIDKIRDYVYLKKLEENVFFVGTTNKIPDYLNVFDIFILPSLFEGLPIVGIEAQSSGLHCIMSTNVTEEVDITGLVEFIPLSSEIDIWVQSILKYQDGYLREDTSSKIISHGYDIKSTARKVEALFNEI